MARDLFQEAGISISTGEGRDLFAEAGIQFEPQKKRRRDVPEMTAGSLARDIAAGVLQIGPTAVKGAADIARLATGDRVGTDTSEAMARGMESIREVVGSERAAAQRENFNADMADDEVGLGEALMRNKGALADQILPTVGSMFLPVGVAGAVGKLATVGKAAQAMDRAALVARVAAAQKVAGIGTVAAQNAADTFAELLEKGVPMEDAYLGAGITVPFSVVAGVLTGGGAEGAITRALTSGAAAKAGLKQFGKATLQEGAQEMGEEAGQITGEAVATGETPSATSVGKQLAVAGTLGAVMGGGVDVANQMGQFRKPEEPGTNPPQPAATAPAPAAASPAATPATDPTTRLAELEILAEQRDLTPAEREEAAKLLATLSQDDALAEAGASPAPAAREVDPIQQELDYIDTRLDVITPANGYGPAFDQEREELAARRRELLEQQRAGQAPTVTQPAPAGDAPVAGAETTRPTQASPTNFWSFAKSKGYKPGDIKVGTPEHAALKAEYDALRQGQTAERPPVEPLNNLPDPALQNRDRSRAASVVQMSEIARNPDYLRLGPSRTPDSGAPMVFAVGDDVSRIPAENFGRQDVAVMSDGQRVPFRYAVVDASQVNPSNFADGRQNPEFSSTAPGTIKALNNGRTAGVRAAHEMGTAGEYVAGMQADEAMHGIPADVIARTPNPMLVRVYSERDNTANMAAKSQGQGLGMSPAELARQDAPLLDTTVLSVYEPGEITSAANRDFVRAFVGKLQTAGLDVAGMMQGNGELSQDGRKRIQAALMQAAYGDVDLVEEMFDSTDTDIKAIGEALKAVAGQWANMRDSARLGAINPQVDVTENLVQAVNLIRKARRERMSLKDLVAQPDLMTGETPDALTVGILRVFYDGQNFTRAVGRDKVVARLEDYIRAAMATSADAGLFGGAPVSPADILATIIGQGALDAQTKPEEGRGEPAGGGDPGGRAGEARPAGEQPDADRGGRASAEDRGAEPGQDAAPEAQQQVSQGDQSGQEGDGAGQGGAAGGQQGSAEGQAGGLTSPGESPLGAKPTTAEQAIREAFRALPSVTLGEFYPITVTHNGRTQQFLVSQRALKRANQPHAALTLVQVRRGRMISGAELQDLAYTYKLTGKNELIEESVKPASEELVKRWRDAGFGAEAKKPARKAKGEGVKAKPVEAASDQPAIDREKLDVPLSNLTRTEQKPEAPALEQQSAIKRHGLPDGTTFSRGKGMASGKWIARAGDTQGNLSATIDEAASSLAQFLQLEKRREENTAAMAALSKKVADKLRRGEQPTDAELRDLFGLDPRHTYVKQSAVGQFLVDYMGVPRNKIRASLGAAAGDVTSDGGVKYPVVYPRKLHQVFGTTEAADEAQAGDKQAIDREKLDKDFRTFPTLILNNLLERGEASKLYKAAGTKGASEFDGLTMDDKAAAYVKFVEQGGKPVENLPKDYNAWVRSQERDIEVRRLQSDRVVRQENGKPFKTKTSAQQFQERYDLTGTHEVKEVEGGFELRQLSPSAQAELKRKAEGRESYTEAQAAVAAEMGIGQTPDDLALRHAAIDAQLDAMSDEQVREVYRRANLAGERRPVEQLRATLKQEHPDDIEPLLDASDPQREDAAAAMADAGRGSGEAAIEAAPPAEQGTPSERARALAIVKAVGRERPFDNIGDLRTAAGQLVRDELGKTLSSIDGLRSGVFTDDVLKALRDGQYEAIQDLAARLPVPVSEEQIGLALAIRAFEGTSHTPEERGRAAVREYVRMMVDAWRRVEAQYEAADEQGKARVLEEFTKLRDGYASRVRAYLASHGQVMSAMIVGPARFQTERNRKRGQAADNKAQEAQDFFDRQMQRVRKAAVAPLDRSPQSELQRLKANLAQREQEQERMKAANAALRKGDDEALRRLGFSDAHIAELKKPDFAGRVGYADYELKNNNAEIRRLRERIEQAEGRVQAAQAGPKTQTFEGVRIEEHAEDDRLRLYFEGKPDDAVRDDLKANGFKWSPRAGAWQRQLTDNARHAARRLLEKHFGAASAAGGADVNLSIADNGPAEGGIWYSPLARAIESLKQNKAPAQDWKNLLNGLKQKGVKEEEIEWSGVREWLDLQEGAVTKDQVLEYLRQGGVKVEEVILGERQGTGLTPEEQRRYDQIGKALMWDDPVSAEDRAEHERLRKKVLEFRDSIAPARYEKYTVPGGQNYREVLLTLPELRPLTQAWRAAQELYGDDDPRTIAAKEAAKSEAKGTRKYKSSHWDQPNVLAHVRIDDRTDADGKRVLFVHEIQSDWGQEGKKRGVGPGVPRAPFVGKTDAWVALALKRVMKMAADEGYDRVAIINGQQAADLYDLSRQVEQIRYIKNDDGTYDVWASDEHGLALNDTVDKQNLKPEQIEEFVGKDVAQRIIDGKGREEDGDMVLEGLDLKVGGEGMRTFYDRIVPNVVKDMLKKLGGDHVMPVRLGGADPKQVAKMYRQGYSEEEITKKLGREGTTEQIGFDITPKMRETLRGGAPLFSVDDGAPATDTATYGPASPEHQRLADTLAGRLSRDYGRAIVLDAVAPGSGAVGGRGRELAAVSTVARRLFGHEVVFVRFNGKPLFNGAMSTAIPDVLFINADATKPMMAVLGHELLHHLKRTNEGIYNTLNDRLNRLKKNERDYLHRLEVLYGRQGEKAPANWDEELNADIVGDFFMDPEFWAAIAKDQPGLFRRVANAIIKFLDDVAAKIAGIRPFGTDQYLTDIAAARAAVVEAMRQFSGAQVGAMTSQSEGINLSVAGLPDTIEVDGVERPTRNSEGRLIHPTEEGIRNFWRWFGDSEVVDDQGRPLVMYHGTNKDFDTFDPDAPRTALPLPGMFFTPYPGVAENYAMIGGREIRDDEGFIVGSEGGNVMPVYLSLQSPKTLRYFDRETGRMTNYKTVAGALQEAKQEGHDGAIIEGWSDGSGPIQYVAFRPEQIKSATGNRGTFDPTNPDIRMSRAPAKKTPAERADEIIAQPAGSRAPLDAIARAVTRVTGIERLTGAIYDRAAYLLDRYTPEKIKAGLVSDYGVPEAVLDQRVLLQGRQRVQLRKAGQLIDKLATLTRAESRVAYEWMNMDGSDPRAYLSMMQGLPEESVKVLTEVQKMIDDLSKEAVRLGQLSPEAYERNKFAYLRRSYAKHILEATQGEKAKRARVISILGDQYKGRGMTESAAMAKIQNAAPEWWGRKLQAGKADTGLKGQKFIRLERRASSGEGTIPMDGIGNRSKGRLLEVAWWPADEKIPPRFADWDRDAAPWVVRDTKGGNLIMWRDYTKEERELMGEVDEARFAIAKTLHGMIHDVEVGRYLEWLSQRYAKKDGETIPGKVVEASERYKDTFATDEWVRVPDTKIPGTSVYKYGKLAGQYIPGPIWNDLRQVVNGQFKPFGDTYAKILSAWKTAKTALSPAVHTNNIMANFVMADWHDVTAAHVAKALRIILGASQREGKGALGRVGNQAARLGIADQEAAREILNRYLDSGGDLGSWVTTEIRENQLEPLLKSLETELAATAGNSMQAQVGVFSALQHALKLRFPSAWEAFKGSKVGGAVVQEGNNLIDLYQHEDDVFRLAAWLKAKEEGKSDLEAGKAARKSFLDYHINAPWIQAMRNSAWPFISFTYRAVPMLAEIAGKKPHKLFKLMAIAGLVNALGVLLAGGGDDDERKLLPEEKAGKIWGMAPKLIRMPWNDAHGSPVYLDIRRWVPVGDVFDVGQGQAAIPMFPALIPGGPLVIFGEVLFNKSAFTGKPITQETDTGAQKAAKVADHLYKAFMPNLLGLPNTYATEGVVGSMTGRTDAFGRELSTPQAVASAFGIKLGSYPSDVLRRNAIAKAQAQQMEIDRNIAQLRRQRQTGRIDADEYRDAVRAEQEKKRRIQKELQEKLR